MTSPAPHMDPAKVRHLLSLIAEVKCHYERPAKR
jgi:hypothetical protein